MSVVFIRSHNVRYPCFLVRGQRDDDGYDVSVQADPRKKSRKEDAIIAWTWKTFIDDPSDPEILLRMPMTKVHAVCVFRLLKTSAPSCYHSSWRSRHRRYRKWEKLYPDACFFLLLNGTTTIHRQSCDNTLTLTRAYATHTHTFSLSHSLSLPPSPMLLPTY